MAGNPEISRDYTTSLIDSEDSLRKGGPGKLPAVPVSTAIPPGTLSPASSAELMNEAKRLCNEYNVPYRLTIFLRHNSREKPKLPDDITLFIEAHASSNQNNEWIRIISNLLEFFREKDFKGRVEITDPIASGGLKTFTLGPDNLLLRDWDRIRLSVLQYLKGSDWTTLVPIKRGYAETTSVITVFVTAVDPTTPAWRNKVTSLKSFLSTELPYDVNVELHSASGLWGSHAPTGNNPDSHTDFPPSLLEKNGRNLGGISCQFKHNPTLGTIGGFLKLTGNKNNGTSAICALTCHHILVRDANGNPLPQAINQRGSSAVEREIGGQYQVAVPCNDRISYFRSGIANQLEQQRKLIDSIATDQKPKLIDAIKTLEHQINTIDNYNGILGKAVATSGFRSVRSGGADWAMDWALVLVTNGRVCSNNLWWIDYTRDFLPLLQTSAFANTTTTGLLSTCAHKKTPVFKCGYASGVTMGYVNEIKQENQMFTGWSKGVTSQSYIVVSARENLYTAAHGDSGSWLVDLEGKLLGIVHGGCNHNKTCFVMPVNDVFDDIRSITGLAPSLEL